MSAGVMSSERVFPGIRPTTLGCYLAGLGLIKALGEQADDNLESWWTVDGLVIRSNVADVADWLVESYRPTPILSPWNGGSGFGAKDKTPRDVLIRLVADDSDRLHGMRTAYAITAPLAAQAAERSWSKERLVAELRNVCPESQLRWLDAAIVLRDQGPLFPPLLGTGGNDGRLDFSTNFHQRLFDVLPELGAKQTASRGWAADLLAGSGGTSLIKAAFGQYNPGAAGGRNSSPYGSAESLVNPWEFVLLIEGALYFASGVARRQGAEQDRAAMPFCVFGSADGPTPGAEGEQSRGEIWVPIWRHGLRPIEVKQLFAESRASWQGELATQAAQMYAALRSFGVSRGIDAFVRFGLHQRNGLAFSAVRLDEVDVQANADIALAVEPERVVQAFQRIQSRPVQAALRRFKRSHLAFVRNLEPTALRNMLAELTLADLAISRSARAREELGRRPQLPHAAPYAQFLSAGLPGGPEFQIAAALASNWAVVNGRRTSVRDLLLGVAPRRTADQWIEPAVPGIGIRPLIELLADLVRWRGHQDEDPGVDRGFIPFPFSIAPGDWTVVHEWVEHPDLDAEVYLSFLACLALDWRKSATHKQMVPAFRPPNPELAMLQAFASGRVGAAVKNYGPLPVDGINAELGDKQAWVVRHGLDRSWPARLLADRTPPGRDSPVLSEIANRLVRLGWQCAPPHRSDVPESRLVAALVCGGTVGPLRKLGASPLYGDDQTNHISDISPDLDEEGNP